MKKIFTLFLGIVCAAVAFAQTPAQEMCNSTFQGSVLVNAGSAVKNKTFANQEVKFTIASDTKFANISFTPVAISALGKTITVMLMADCPIEVEKSGSTFKLKNNTFTAGISNDGVKFVDITGQVTSSNIDIAGKTASVSIKFTNLPSAMQALKITEITADYSNLNLTGFVPAGITDITVDNQKVTTKFVKNGKVVIRRNNTEYNVAGQMLK